jgi:hypothetical protein
VALLTLLAAVHDGTAPDHLPKVDVAHSYVEGLLQREVPPRFRAFLLAHDTLIPGFSLRAFFGA